MNEPLIRDSNPYANPLAWLLAALFFFLPRHFRKAVAVSFLLAFPVLFTVDIDGGADGHVYEATTATYVLGVLWAVITVYGLLSAAQLTWADRAPKAYTTLTAPHRPVSAPPGVFAPPAVPTPPSATPPFPLPPWRQPRSIEDHGSFLINDRRRFADDD